MANAIIIGKKSSTTSYDYGKIFSAYLETNNKVSNGHFTSTSNWVTNFSTTVVSDGSLLITGTATNAADGIYQPRTAITSSHKIYTAIKYYTASATSITFGPVSNNISISPALNSWGYAGGSVMENVGNDADILYFGLIAGETARAKAYYRIDMTALGITSYTDAQMLELVKQAQTYWETVH